MKQGRGGEGRGQYNDDGILLFKASLFFSGIAGAEETAPLNPKHNAWQVLTWPGPQNAEFI